VKLFAVCDRRRHLTPTDVSSPHVSQSSPSRCWSGPSLRSLGMVTDDSQQTAPHKTNDGSNSDVELLVKTTHRGYGSLHKIYPQWTSHDIDRLRLFDGVVDMFLECVVGTRDQTRMNSQTFRNFVRSGRHFLLKLMHAA